MSQEDTTRSDEPAILAVIDAIARAVRSNDVESFLAHCAADIVVFDMLAPLEHKGADGVRKNWATALAPFEGPVEYDVDHLGISVNGDVAFSRYLTVFGGTTKAGAHVLHRLRTTLGLRKVGGRWQIAHQHVSVPFDMHSGKALLDLKA